MLIEIILYLCVNSHEPKKMSFFVAALFQLVDDDDDVDDEARGNKDSQLNMKLKERNNKKNTTQKKIKVCGWVGGWVGCGTRKSIRLIRRRRRDIKFARRFGRGIFHRLGAPPPPPPPSPS